MKTKEFREQLAESFLHVLEERQLEWKKEWSGLDASPVNGSSGRCYHGINRLHLMLVALQRGYKDYRWCTFTQIKEKKWKLSNAKGQGVVVEYWFPYDTQDKHSMSWDVFRKTGERLGERYVLRASYKTVFNAELIDGIPQMPIRETKEIPQDILVKRISENIGVPILHDGGDQAFYRPGEDQIHLPSADSFDTEYAYDSTALHELAHATGAAHRLNRLQGNGFGSPEYAFEELIAEISSCFLSANLRIEQTEQHIQNHKAYVQSWMQTLRENPELLVKAVQQAERAAVYMEYKAELIERKEYEQVFHSAMEVKEEEIETPSAEKQREIQRISSKTRSELQDMEQDIRTGLQDIRQDTQFFREFAKRQEIPLPEPDSKKASEELGLNVREYYVIEDQESGKTVLGENGEELQLDRKEEAEQVVAALNQGEQMPRMAEVLIREYEQSIGRKETVLDRYTEEEILSYAAMCQKYLAFGQSVDRVLEQGDIPMREAVKVCDTPELFLEAGFRQYPMHITQKHLRDCIHEKSNRNMHYHGLTREEFKRIPEALENPVLIAESLTRENAVIAVLGYREQEGLPIMVSIVPGGKAVYHLETVNSNFITSAYGRGNMRGFLQRIIEKGNLLYINKEKSEELALLPLPLRQDHPAPAFDCIIKRIGEDVNALPEAKSAKLPTIETTVKAAMKVSEQSVTKLR